MQFVLHPQQPGGLGLLQAGDRDPGPARDDEGDRLLVYDRTAGLPLLFPLVVLLPDLLLQLALLVPQRSGALEVLVPDGLFLVDVDLL